MCVSLLFSLGLFSDSLALSLRLASGSGRVYCLSLPSAEITVCTTMPSSLPICNVIDTQFGDV